MSFDETIVRCSAPALCGIKPASLFSMSGECFDSGILRLKKWRAEFSRASRYVVPLKKDGGRVLFFVFDRPLLERVCADSKNRAYLEEKGYPVSRGFAAILSEILHRLAFRREFPHEVGLFLGYPLEDVRGFEKDSSAYKFAGFWKVYGDKAEAEKRMKLYKSCSEFCMKWVDAGLNVPLSIQKYIQKGA